MSIEARYHGICHECGGRWAPGDLIQSGQEMTFAGLPTWQHAVCPDGPDDPSLKPGESVCQDCWLVHPEGKCDR